MASPPLSPKDTLGSASASTAATASPSAPAGLDRWIARLLADDRMLKMGHGQRRDDLNLGMGWLYYGLARMIRPTRVVAIGSWRGFAPMVLAKGLSDNAEGGSVTFLDPSLVDDHWTDPDRVQEWFRGFGIDNIEHYRLTTQQFVETAAYQELDEIGIVFIDGHHTEAQARYDFEAFAGRVPPHGVLLLHDSVIVRDSLIYGADRPYQRTVRLFVETLRADPALQVFDLPYCEGLTLVRRVGTDAGA